MTLVVEGAAKTSPATLPEVNKQDFLQVFQSSGIGKIEDNITSADQPSYTTTIMIQGRPGKLSERLLTKTHSTASCEAPDHKHWTDREVSNSSLNYPPKTIEEGV